MRASRTVLRETQGEIPWVYSPKVTDGIYEYQHSTGSNSNESLLKGFDQWAKTDLTALLEALQPKPKICATLEIELPLKEGKPAYSRRAILGPVTQWGQN